MKTVPTLVFCEACARLFEAIAAPATKTVCPYCSTSVVIPENHEVFISYATPNLPVAQQVAAALHHEKINFWFAPRQIDLGESFLEEISSGLERSKITLVLLSDHAMHSEWVVKEVVETLRLKHKVLPVLIGDPTLTGSWPLILGNIQCLSLSRSQQEPLQLLMAAIHGTLLVSYAKPEDPPLPPAETRIEVGTPKGVGDFSPYVGPKPFESKDANRLYGREETARNLVSIIQKSRLVLVYAPSGAGKSSLLNAKVAQGLSAAGLKVYLNLRVGACVPEQDSGGPESVRNLFEYSLLSDLGSENPNGKLTEYLGHWGSEPGTQGRVLVIDQFEELFTRYRDFLSRRKDRHDRDAFFQTLIQALHKDESLRIVLVIRDEFLARVEKLADDHAGEIVLQRFPIYRLGRAEALRGITRPALEYAVYADGVAEALVDQLDIDNSIELLHLQIVCARLWETLERGLTCIEEKHLRQASGGKSVEDFVENALDLFYDSTLEKVSQSRETRERGGYSKELLHFGCTKFVDHNANRVILKSDGGHVGRLPEWVVRQLEDAHLLSCETRGDARWHELSHDLLTAPIAGRRDRESVAMLHAADLLDKMIEAGKHGQDGTLKGYFRDHPDILRECERFRFRPGLFPEEAEFIFRAALMSESGEMFEWSRFLAQDFPAEHERMLAEAFEKSTPAAARRNASILLASRTNLNDIDTLLEVSLDGQEHRDVRIEAALTLVQRDHPAVVQKLKSLLGDPANREAAMNALVEMRMMADRLELQAGGSELAPAFENAWRELKQIDRLKIRLRVMRLRSKESISTWPYIFLPAAVFGAISGALVKWFPGMFNWAICQSNASAGMGLFHGLIAGSIWGGLIAFGVGLHHLTLGAERNAKGYLQPLGALATGLMSGFLSSLLVILSIVGVYRSGSLYDMGWVSLNEDVSFIARVNDVFFHSRLGWLYLVTGTGLGLGTALMINGLRACRHWRKFCDAQRQELQGLRHAWNLLTGIVQRAILHFWPVPIVLALSAWAAFQLPNFAVAGSSDTPNLIRQYKGSPQGVTEGLIGDCGTQAFGGFFSVVGMGFGVLLMQSGFRIKPRRLRSWKAASRDTPEAGGA